MTFSIGQNVIDIEIKALKLLKKSIDRDQFETAVNYLYKTRFLNQGLATHEQCRLYSME